MASGQLANASATIEGAASVQHPVSVFFYNTDTVQETVTLELTVSGGSKLTLCKFILQTGEHAVVSNIALGPADILTAFADVASKVNYFTLPQGGPVPLSPVALNVYDNKGAMKSVNGTAVTSATTITVASAAALAVGLNGATNPAFDVDSSVASQATGIKVTGRAAAAGASIAVISSGGNESLTVDAKGSGNITIGGTSTGILSIGRGSVSTPVFSSTKTSIATQNGTPTAAQLLGGYISHASTTGAGTLTLDTAANIDTAIAGVATGDSFECVYANTGSQTVTVTTAVGLSLKGTLAVGSGKNAVLNFFRTGAGAWDVTVSVSA